MSKTIIFKDCFKLSKPEAEQIKEFKDAYPLGGHGSTKRALRVYLDATHSAIINRNMRFYLPSRMESGVEFFTKNKKAPVLKHHAADADPVGKIVSAEYISTVPESMTDLPEIIALTDNNMSLKKQIRAAKKFIKNGVADQEGWKGLGYIRLGADIIDDKAIEQIENGLFDAVSVGFKSNHAFCSICQADWMDDDDGVCEHFPPGRKYKNEDGETEQQYLIPGDMYFKECSLVNFDADPHTAIEISQFGDAEDSDNMTFDDVEGVFPSTNMTWEVRDFEEAVNMKTIEVKDGVTIELSDAEEKIFNLLKEKTEGIEDAILAENAKKIEALRNEDGFLPDQKEAGLDNETAVLYANDDLMYNDEETFDAEAHYEDIVKELELMVDEELLTKEEFEDAKLSTAQRKGLSGKTFCGPGRSFPVPDCAHVTAARRLIGRYKGPGSKSNILACVARKAKALGCGGSKGDSANDAAGDGNDGAQPCDEFAKMTDDELRTYFHAVEVEMVGRNLTVKRECSECASNIKRAEDAEKDLGELKEKFDDASGTLAILREELRIGLSDYVKAIDDAVEARVAYKRLQTEYASLASVVIGKHKDLDAAKKFFTDAEDFDAEIKLILDSEENTKALQDKIVKMYDGTTGDPEGTVESPVINGDDENEQNPEGLSPAGVAVVARVKELIEDGEFAQARSLYGKMLQYGVLNDSIKFETISAANDADE